MWPVTERWRPAIAGGARRLARGSLHSPSGDQVAVQVRSGSVTADRGRTIRRTCTVDLVDPTGTLVPTDPAHPLHPVAGWRLHLDQGIRYPDGDTEWVPAGRYVISRPKLTETTGGINISVDGEDYARAISDARWTSVVTLSGNLATIIRDEVSTRLPGVTIELDGMAYSTQPVHRGGSEDDPMDVLRDLAAAGTRDLAFGPDATLRSPPVADTGDEYDAVGLTLEASRDLDPATTYNGVVVTGEHPDLEEPVSIEVLDDDESSPTRWGGPFGMKPYFMQSQYISDEDQARAAGLAQLDRSRTVVETMDLTCVPDAAVDVGDLVRLSRLGASGLAVIERTSMPLGLGTMQLETRRRVD